jgi:hypothetical protein
VKVAVITSASVLITVAVNVCVSIRVVVGAGNERQLHAEDRLGHGKTFSKPGAEVHPLGVGVLTLESLEWLEESLVETKLFVGVD